MQDDPEQEGAEADKGHWIPPGPAHHGADVVCPRAVRSAVDVCGDGPHDGACVCPQLVQ